MKARIVLTVVMVLLALGLHLWSLASVESSLAGVVAELEQIRTESNDAKLLTEKQKSAISGAEVRLMKIHSNQLVALLPIHLFFLAVIACLPFARMGKGAVKSQEPQHD
jgi:hypothetical protein